MRGWRTQVWIAALAAGIAACGAGVTEDESRSGGATTVIDTTRDAFSRPARNLSEADRDRFFVGNAIFNRTWVSAPASAEGVDGLGPRFNATACSACHFKDGRGAPPNAPGERPVALLFRLSVPGTDAHGGPMAEPTYGGQFAPSAILGVPPDGRMTIDYDEIPGAFGDGAPYSLRRPRYGLVDLAYGPARDDVMISPRVAPAIIGMGLLEAITEANVVAQADPDDRDGDGISGRANYVWSVRASRRVLGRFGWKANQPDVEQQAAGAFLGDMGITSSLFERESCTDAMAACRTAPSGGAPEIDDLKLDAVVRYTRALAVPARRDLQDPTVRRGQARFAEAGCAKCHTPRFVTGTHGQIAALSNQVIRPYTDLLLHDMGDALADGRPDFDATGREWRTPPLWGLGLQRTVSGHTMLLHDGRARDSTEAILWHGGEAERAKETFRTMPQSDRVALLAFLDSL